MRKYVLGAVVCAVILASGCSAGASNTTVKPADEGTGPVVVTTAASGEGLLEQEALEASMESMEARLEALESLAASVEESVSVMEESVHEVMSSMAEEASLTFEEEAGEEAEAGYEDLINATDDYKGRELTFSGTILQIADLNNGRQQAVIAVDEDEDHGLVCEYSSGLLPGMPGHGDLVTVTGIFSGVYRYMTGNGTRLALPSMEVRSIRIDRTAETEPVVIETTAAETVAWPSPETTPETTSAPLPSGPLGSIPR